MRRTAVLLAAAAAWIAAGSAFATGDPAAGKSKAAVCGACHGPDGNSPNPLWPKLAGQHAPYLVKQLAAFKSGARKDPLMSPMAAGLSEKDMEDLAAFFSSQSPK
jgi:cytochrome c553